MRSRGCLLVDANVLVDYQAADLAILSLVSRHIGRVHIVSTVLAEVEGLDDSVCEQHGFTVVEPDIYQTIAAARPNGRLSLADRFCFVLCHNNGWTCVTNDRALRRECESAGVAVLWSLELLLELVKLRQLPANDASQAANQMHRANPTFLGPPIISAFHEKLSALVAQSGA